MWVDLADWLGLRHKEENSIVIYMNLQPECLNNAENMLLEMIHQHYNHPAVVKSG